MPSASKQALLRRALAATIAALAALVATLVGLATHVPARLAAPAGYRADLLLVPSGDPDDERTRMASALLLGGRGDRMLISGTGYGGDSASYLADRAVELGVPRERIVLEEHARFTWENMQLSAPIVAREGARTVLVVTSRSHARRAGLVAEVMMRGVEVKVAAVPGEVPLRIRAREAAKTVRYVVLGHVPLSSLFAW